MPRTVSATTLVRQLGEILGRIRYRGESFVIERNGVAVARLVPIARGRRGNLVDALHHWRDAGAPEPEFAAALDRVGHADRAPGDPWAS